MWRDMRVGSWDEMVDVGEWKATGRRRRVRAAGKQCTQGRRYMCEARRMLVRRLTTLRECRWCRLEVEVVGSRRADDKAREVSAEKATAGCLGAFAERGWW